MHAHLNPGERGVGQLPEKIEEASFSEDGKDYFRLPCHYFSGKCSIYSSKRADVCASYRCQLLRDHAEGKISTNSAMKIIGEARKIRDQLLVEYHRLTEVGNDVFFRQVLTTMAGYKEKEKDFEMLQSMCNIFEALLIKHFRSAEDFEKMIMK